MKLVHSKDSRGKKWIKEQLNKYHKLKEEASTPLETEVIDNEALPKNGMADIINKLIIDEWDAIQGYQDAITMIEDLKNRGEADFSNIANIFKDISAEESVHVGQLEEALKTIQPSIEKISDGEEEAAEMLDNIDVEVQANNIE